MHCGHWAIWSSARGALLAALLALSACGSAPRADGPDLLVVTLDTLRVDYVGAYGGRGELTPHLDALARRGLVHDAAFTTMPTTGPAHVSLFTGLAPSAHGAVANGRPMDPARSDRELARQLGRAGYASAAFVSTRLLTPNATGLSGFEIYDAPRAPARSGADTVEAALRWVGVADDCPLLLWVHIYDPHAPYGSAEQKSLAMPLRADEYGWVDPRRYAAAVSRQRMAAYYATGVRDADRALGALLEGLAQRRDRPLLVAVTADHGEALDEHLDERGYAYDHGEFLDLEQVRVPLVLAGDGVVPGRSPGTVSVADLYATLLSAGGVADEAVEGRDLRTTSDTPRRVIIERRPFSDAELPPQSSLAALVRRHAAAATDGETLVVVGEDGAPAFPDADPELLGAARAAVGAVGTIEPPTPELDPELRDALRSLGYSE